LPTHTTMPSFFSSSMPIVTRVGGLFFALA
jgi:hypothetical protein